MPTIAELKTILKRHGLSTTGNKATLMKRLNMKESASVKRLPEINSLVKFYISLYFQKPDSKLAKDWLRSKGLTHANALVLKKKMTR